MAITCHIAHALDVMFEEKDFSRVFEYEHKDFFILSDYSGTTKKKGYRTYAFLIFQPYAENCFFRNQKLIRADFLGDGRRIAFKGLNDRNKINALIPLLATYNQISGCLISISVSNAVMFRQEGAVSEKIETWKPKIRGRLLDISDFCAYLIKKCFNKEERIFWITDLDDIAQNHRQVEALELILTDSLTDLGVSEPTIHVHTSESDDPENRRIEDVLSVCDLVAGAMSEVVSVTPIPKIDMFVDHGPSGLSWKSNLISSWLVSESNLIKFPHVIISHDTSLPGDARVTSLHPSNSNPFEN
ncbi:MAG: hypothetical protein WD075_02125 [Rhodospirillales bacterium]